VTLTQVLAVIVVIMSYAYYFALNAPVEGTAAQGNTDSILTHSGTAISGDGVSCDFYETPSPIPALASAYACWGRTACMTQTKLAPYRTLAMSTKFREKHDFHYGDLFEIDAFPDVVWVYADHIPAKYHRDLDLFLGDRKAAREWGVRRVLIMRIGHLTRDDRAYEKKEAYFGRY